MAKTGYTFAGWNTAANGSGTHYAAGATFAMGSSQRNSLCPVDRKRSTPSPTTATPTPAGSVPTDGNTYHTTDSVTVLGNTGGLVKTGYTFAGWNTAANGSGTHYAAGATFAMGSSNVTLYAQWTANEYRVEFVTDGTARATLAGDLVQTVAYGTACTPVTAIAPPGGEFLGWSGGYTGMENPLTVTNVTSALTILANFEEGQVAYGSLFEVDARDAGLDQFTVKPEVYATFTNPVTGREGQKATVKVLTTIDREVGATILVCEWSKRLRLYDAKAFRAAENSGVGAAGWITEANQHDLVMDLRLASTEAEDQSIQSLVLAVPVITAIIPGDPDPDGNATLVIIGKWFGTKKPNVWQEYVVQGRDGEVVKRQAMKVVAPSADNTGLIDNKGEPSYMDAVTGDSQLIVVVPARLPNGVLNGTIVLENGVGLASWRWEAGSHPAERPE